MIEHPAFPADEWTIRETSVDLDVLGQSETLLALANGYLGVRGNLDEPDPAFEAGAYINGFYETRPIEYGERAYGYASTDQTMLNVTDGKVISLLVDGEPLDIRTGTLEEHTRVLDMRAGTMTRELEWISTRGRRVRVTSTRLVSFEHRHLAAIQYEVEVLDEPAHLTISSQLVPNKSSQTNTGDPRESAVLYGQVLLPVFSHGDGERVVLGHITRNSKLPVVSGMDHVVETDSSYTTVERHSDDQGRIDYEVDAVPGRPFRLVKYLAYHTSRSPAAASPDKLLRESRALLDHAVSDSFDSLARRQRAHLDDYWSRADVVIEGDPAVQQAVRFALFQILQASARADDTGIPAKGLTGQGYEGHYFWDQEAFVLSVLTYVEPSVARSVLLWRYAILDKSRERAATMSQRGALFPWRTINGDEASAYYPAGTAQYHIDADVMYALAKYVRASGDTDLLYEYGAEMLVETARLWLDLGHWSDRRGGAFCIDEVTGPDEYSALVDNNAYTNLMAAANLRYAAETARHLHDDQPQAWSRLAAKTEVGLDEVDEWQRAADAVYLHVDERLGVHGQDDAFLDQEPWDFDGTPPERYPLLLHYHPLVIYRRQVIKQADLVLAMFFQGQAFTADEKRRNFDYYDPLTTGDSSLSACVQAVLAAEIGEIDKAYGYARRTALMDLENVNHNVRDGVHIAAMAGTWVALIHGFGGFRDHEGRLAFAPRLPREWTRLRFSLTLDGRVLDVDIGHDETSYSLRSGAPLTVYHWTDEVTVTADAPVTVTATP